MAFWQEAGAQPLEDRPKVLEPAKVSAKSLDRREALWTRNGIVASTVLIDGRVGAVCKVDSDKHGARLRVRPYERLSKTVAREITVEGEALLAAMGGTFAAGEVTIEAAGSAWSPTWD